MSEFKKLDVWHKAPSLALEVHSTAQGIRGSSYVSLRSQLIRSAMSVPANIVEGREQASEKEFARFLRYSIASASELEYHLLVGRDMRLITYERFDTLIERLEQVRRMLRGLLAAVERRHHDPSPTTTA